MNIVETTFGPKRYLTLRKEISTSQITDKQMYDEAGKKLGSYITEHNVQVTGPWTVLYFMWNEGGGQAEIGISFPVEGITKTDNDLEITEIPALKAAMATLDGSYDGLREVHEALGKHIAQQKYALATPVTAIEEYVIDPMGDPDPNNWKTNVYYLHS